jgi:tRNA1Val (adenine37-N6)-methyltransferase
MSNTWFQFKKFRIEQNKCGMKVSTDACVFGAIVTEVLQQFPQYKKGLDIGTGTGLLTLMLAQEHENLNMDAVEIDNSAYEQALCNFKKSDWFDKLRLYHSSVQKFSTVVARQYDVIICNPPFFSNHLTASTTQRTLARHDVSLTHWELLSCIQKLLQKDGLVFLLYPSSEVERVMTAITTTDLMLIKTIKIYPNYNKMHNRVVYILGKRTNTIDYSDTIYIRESKNQYSSTYLSLLEKYLL